MFSSVVERADRRVRVALAASQRVTGASECHGSSVGAVGVFIAPVFPLYDPIEPLPSPASEKGRGAEVR